MIKIALGLEYDGSTLNGWQLQATGFTVQQAVEDAISKIARQLIKVTAAGRTDAKVHALEQVLHFKTTTIRTMRAWCSGINRYLPDIIRVLWAVEVAADFNARFSAIRRSYRYIIYNNKIRPALLINKVSWYCRDLNIYLMQQVVQFWLGRHDFTAFQGRTCQSNTAIREIFKINIINNGNFIIIDITANSFLYHMVRNLVGVLLPIGYGDKPISWAKEVLDKKKRSFAGITALPHGLYLSKVNYPRCYKLPDSKKEWLYELV